MNDSTQYIEELTRLARANTKHRQPLARLLRKIQKSMKFGEFRAFCQTFSEKVAVEHISFDAKTVYAHAKWGSVLEDLAGCSTNPKSTTAGQTGDYDFIDDSLPLTVSLSKIIASLPQGARIEVWRRAQAESKSNQPTLNELEYARQLLYPQLPESSSKTKGLKKEISRL